MGIDCSFQPCGVHMQRLFFFFFFRLNGEEIVGFQSRRIVGFQWREIFEKKGSKWSITW